MNHQYLTPSFYATVALALTMLLLAACNELSFPIFSLERETAATGDLWRLLSGNFVHFGWPHTLMNVAALLLCSFALLLNFSLASFSVLVLWCCAAVGAGIFYLNPEYSTYAGFSGAIHGLIVAGLALSKQHPLWMRLLFTALLVTKLVQEQRLDYQATDLQALLPVPVAVDAHLYGAIAGTIFVVAFGAANHLKKGGANARVPH